MATEKNRTAFDGLGKPPERTFRMDTSFLGVPHMDALVFCLPKQKPLDGKQIIAELLKYYRGLAVAVGRGKNLKMDPAKFTLTLKGTKGREVRTVWTPLSGL